MDTLFLNPKTWDLDVDASGSIALSTDEYAISQDIGSQSRLWKGEAPFNNEDGIPYDSILGHMPSESSLAAWYRAEAMRVPGVKSATVVLKYENKYDDERKLTGQIQATLEDGTIINV